MTSSVLALVLDMTEGVWSSPEALGTAYDEVCAAKQMYLLGDARRKACIIGVGGDGAAHLTDTVGTREEPWPLGEGLRISNAVAFAMCFAAKHAPEKGGAVVVVAGSAIRDGEHMALMNTAFAASTIKLTLNSVWITKKEPDHLLTQACAAANGVALTPRVGDAGLILPTLLQAFVANSAVPGSLQLPRATSIDTRATCLQTGKLLDLGLVCSVCFGVTHPDVGAQSLICPTCKATLQPPAM